MSGTLIFILQGIIKIHLNIYIVYLARHTA